MLEEGTVIFNDLFDVITIIIPTSKIQDREGRYIQGRVFETIEVRTSEEISYKHNHGIFGREMCYSLLTYDHIVRVTCRS